MMLKVAQVAKRLNCSVSTVYGLIETGRLAHHRCPGVRVSEEQLEVYLADTKRQPSPEPARSARSGPQLRLKNVKL
ncbi:MAG: helix-turn-helix domain-containing protein [Planctomycetes bacterium]|nr:helix-turn-helix domain-containing protein [Planctomycetota bacterium]